jgi:hypothetical protein
MPTIADMLLDGNIKAAWVPTIANIAAPTVAELTAGVDLADRLTPDGLNISFDTSMIDNSALSSTYDTEQVGRSKVTTTLKYKAGAIGTTDDVRDALSFRAVGYLVVRRGVDSATAWTAAQEVEVYPSQCGRPNPDVPAPNMIQTVTVQLGSTGTPRGFDNPAVIAGP